MTEVTQIYGRLNEILEGANSKEVLAIEFRDHRLAVLLGRSFREPNVLINVYSGPEDFMAFNVAENGEMRGESSGGEMYFNHGEHGAIIDQLIAGKFQPTSYTRQTLDDFFAQPESEEKKNKPGSIVIWHGALERKEGETSHQAACRFSDRIRSIGCEADLVAGGVSLFFNLNDLPKILNVFEEFGLDSSAIEQHDGGTGIKLTKAIKAAMSK